MDAKNRANRAAHDEGDTDGRRNLGPTNRYWVSWWSAYHKDLGHTAPPFQTWISGEREADNEVGDEVSLVAVVDAPSEDAIWEVVAQHMPDFQPRFCDEVAYDFVPNNRFPGFEGRTSLEARADD